MEKKKYFISDREIENVNDVSLIQVAEKMGYHVCGNERYSRIKEMDSLTIFNDRTWCRFSRKTRTGITGGNAITFLRELAGMDFREAVTWLQEFKGDAVPSRPAAAQQKKRLVLPDRSWDNATLTRYLHEKRCITEETINEMMQLGILYESFPKHDLIFLGYDRNGEVRYAAVHGTGEVSCKKDLPGSAKEYGVHVDRSNAGTVVVTEAVIDLMSYLDLETDRVNILSLGGLYDSPLERYLKEHDEVQDILFALDNDVPGKEAFAKYKAKYGELGFRVSAYPIPEEYKDLNEYLQGMKKR